MRLRTTVLDDRSRRVPLMYIGFGHRLIAALLPGVTAIPADRYGQIIADMHSAQKSLNSRYVGRAILIGMMPAIIANVPTIVGFSARSFLSPWFWCFLVAWLILSFPVMIFIMWHFLAMEIRSTIAKAIVRQRCCASCGYPLEGLTPEDDERTTCPECGAAWKLAPQP